MNKYFHKKGTLSVNNVSNYYSILYYNADIWLIPTVSPNIYKQLRSASAAPLRLLNYNFDHQVSFKPLYWFCNRASLWKEDHAICIDDNSKSNIVIIIIQLMFDSDPGDEIGF